MGVYSSRAAAVFPTVDATDECAAGCMGSAVSTTLPPFGGDVFQGIVEKGTQANQWTEREASAVNAYTRTFEQHSVETDGND
jgi:hypothetical protein